MHMHAHPQTCMPTRFQTYRHACNNRVYGLFKASLSSCTGVMAGNKTGYIVCDQAIVYSPDSKCAMKSNLYKAEHVLLQVQIQVQLCVDSPRIFPFIQCGFSSHHPDSGSRGSETSSAHISSPPSVLVWFVNTGGKPLCGESSRSYLYFRACPGAVFSFKEASSTLQRGLFCTHMFRCVHVLTNGQCGQGTALHQTVPGLLTT